MNGYTKRLLVFKSTQSVLGDDNKPIKGIATVTVTVDETKIELNVYNLPVDSAQSIVATVYICGEFYLFDLPSKKRAVFKISKPADLRGKTLVLLSTALGKTLCYAAISGGELLIQEGELYAKKIIYATDKIVGEKSKSNEFFTQKSSEEFAYDDYRLATENYYRLDDAKLIYEKNEPIQNRNSEETKKSENHCDLRFNEENIYSNQSGDYYLAIQDKIKELLANNPVEQRLNDVLPGGNFVKISYDKTRAYTFGTIEQGGSIKYVCYGVPVNAKNPAPRLKYAKFIPIDIFNLSGAGYYLVFEDAKNGKII